jgi:hypothetical protein
MPGPKIPRPKQRERCQHERERVVQRRIGAPIGAWNWLKTVEPMPTMTARTRTFTRRHHVAEHPLGQECGLVPQRKWHQHEAGERRELELHQRHEELHREHEEAHDHEIGDKQHHDTVQVQNTLVKPDNWPICCKIG